MSFDKRHRQSRSLTGAIQRFITRDKCPVVKQNALASRCLTPAQIANCLDTSYTASGRFGKNTPEPTSNMGARAPVAAEHVGTSFSSDEGVAMPPRGWGLRLPNARGALALLLALVAIDLMVVGDAICYQCLPRWFAGQSWYRLELLYGNWDRPPRHAR